MLEKILIVDDHPSTLRLIKTMVEDAGFVTKPIKKDELVAKIKALL